MPALKPITIVGGGLAGLTLGIGLRQCGIPVTIFEAGRYPRHRVCGEFISGRGPSVLERLGLMKVLESAGVFRARTVEFVSGENKSPVRRLPEAALCLSRYSLDEMLANEFQSRGGELRLNTRWNEPEREGVTHASGRRPHSTENGWRWFGLKAHARNVKLDADLEMHLTPTGYVGVNRINCGEVNVCGLFRARPSSGVNMFSTERKEENKEFSGASSPAVGRAKRSAEHCSALRFMETASLSSVQTRPPIFQLLYGAPGSLLHERLAAACFDENSFCSVAGLSLKPQRAMETAECRLGDALTMTPPVTGNGMSMAFESAAAAIAPLADFSRGRHDWAEARRQIARGCDAAFARRLRWARILQRLMFSAAVHGRVGQVLMRSDLMWNWMFYRTR